MTAQWEAGDEKGWRSNTASIKMYVYLCVYEAGFHDQNNTEQAILIRTTLLNLTVADK